MERSEIRDQHPRITLRAMRASKAPPSLFFSRRGRARIPTRIPHPLGNPRARGTPGFQRSPWPHARSESAHEIVVTTDRRKRRRSARGVSGLLCDNPGGQTPLTGIAGRTFLISSAGDPRPVSRIIAAWASAEERTSCAPQRPPHPAPRLMTLIRRPLDEAGCRDLDQGKMAEIRNLFLLPHISASCPGRAAAWSEAK